MAANNTPTTTLRHPHPRGADDRSMTRAQARTYLQAAVVAPDPDFSTYSPQLLRNDAAWRLRWLDCAPAGAWHQVAPLQDKLGVPCGTTWQEHPGSGLACNPHVRAARARRGLHQLSGVRLTQAQAIEQAQRLGLAVASGGCDTTPERQVWNMECEQGAELLGTYLRTEEDAVYYRGATITAWAPADCVMVLATGTTPCTCAVEDDGDGESGPHLAITAVDEHCPTHGRATQPEVWAQGEAMERGYLVTGVQGHLDRRGYGHLDCSADPELLEQLLVHATQALEAVEGTDDQAEPMYHQDRAIGRVADALLVLYGDTPAAPAAPAAPSLDNYDLQQLHDAWSMGDAITSQLDQLLELYRRDASEDPYGLNGNAIDLLERRYLPVVRQHAPAAAQEITEAIAWWRGTGEGS